MADVAVEKVGDGRKPDMRVRADVERLVALQHRRAEPVEEDERADEPSLRVRQRAAHLEAAEILRAGDDHRLDCIAGIGIAWDRIVSGEEAHGAVSGQRGRQ